MRGGRAARVVALVGALAALLPASAGAQWWRQAPPLETGAIVRVRAGGGSALPLELRRDAGRLERVDADSVVLRDGERRIALPRGEVKVLERYAGRRSRGGSIASGALLGFVSGALGGTIVTGSVLGVAGRRSNGGDDPVGTDGEALAVAAASGLLGAFVGGGYGAGRPLDVWERVPLRPALRVGLTAAPGRVGVSIGR